MKQPKKTKTPGQSIITGVKQAIAWAAGKDIPVKKTIIMVPHVDVREVRTRMHLSQNQFAQRFGFAPASVRNWEQGRRQPEGPARVLLAVIERHPKAVESILTSTKTHSAR
ncbi:Transcriptional regulator, XRE family [Candidatus Sulfopaludibacter sp. SbA4]|nr:Transcriptional regulator, XRE family [Candidatus Sulfopaludibacter sp. SbA4]